MSDTTHTGKIRDKLNEISRIWTEEINATHKELFEPPPDWSKSKPVLTPKPCERCNGVGTVYE